MYICLWQSQTMFELLCLTYFWLLPPDKLKELISFSTLFLHIGWKYLTEIWYASLSWIVKDRNPVLLCLNYFPLNDPAGKGLVVLALHSECLLSMHVSTFWCIFKKYKLDWSSEVSCFWQFCYIKWNRYCNNAPYLVMFTGVFVRINQIELVYNKHAFIVPDKINVNFKRNIRQKTQWM
jgi:hypothetical protein